MTDLEIDERLALAIGWREDQLYPYETHLVLYVRGHFAKRFSHKDWNVIGPIAERYDVFPTKSGSAAHYDEWFSRIEEIYNAVYADTPQKAIALAVIGANK